MILLTGATGFTGRFVSEVLLARKIPFKCLVRDTVKSRHLADSGVPCVPGDLRDEYACRKALTGCSGIINLVSFKEEHIPLILHEASRAGIRRVLFIGTTAIFTQLNTASKSLRVRAEEAISQSGLDWTILRPTMIYGARGDRNMERLILALRRFPVHPILGEGDHLLQPIHVQDLARAIVDAYSCRAANQRAFNLSGKNALTYRQLVTEVARLMQRRILMFSLPRSVSLCSVRIAARIPGLPRIKAEQVLRLDEDKAFSHREAAETWGFDPVDFTTGIRMELHDLGILAQ